MDYLTKDQCRRLYGVSAPTWDHYTKLGRTPPVLRPFGRDLYPIFGVMNHRAKNFGAPYTNIGTEESPVFSDADTAKFLASVAKVTEGVGQ